MKSLSTLVFGGISGVLIGSIIAKIFGTPMSGTMILCVIVIIVLGLMMGSD